MIRPLFSAQRLFLSLNFLTNFLEYIEKLRHGIIFKSGKLTFYVMTNDGFKVERTSTVFFVRLPDGSKAYLKYSVVGDRLSLIETYTPEAYRGRGLAKLLVDEAVEYAVEKGLRIVPLCSYSVYYFIKFRDRRVLLADEYRDMGESELGEYYRERLGYERSKRSS